MPTSSARRRRSSTPDGRRQASPRPAGRVTAEDVAAVAFESGPAYVCGSSGFVETVAMLLVDAGYSAGADPAGAVRPDRLTLPE